MTVRRRPLPAAQALASSLTAALLLALPARGQSADASRQQLVDGGQWTVPINVTVSKMARFGPFPASYGIGAGYFVEKPTGGADWKLRMAVTIILPKRGGAKP